MCMLRKYCLLTVQQAHFHYHIISQIHAVLLSCKMDIYPYVLINIWMSTESNQQRTFRIVLVKQYLICLK